MFENAPNGFFVRDLIVFNHLRRGGFVSKGFVFEAPDLTNSPIADLNDFQEQLCLLLASLQENQRLQVQYFSDSDYKAELLRYRHETEGFANVWTQRARNERFTRYWQAMTERQLRRQRVVLYVSRALENIPRLAASGAMQRYYLTLLDQLQTEFAHVHRLLVEIFANAGARVLPMSDIDHFRHCKTFLNPSLADRFDFDCAADFLPELSIQENCWHSEGNGQSDFGFFMDGHYHSVVVLTRWPRSTYPGIVQRLTNLRLLDFTVTVNIDPLPITREINKEEKEHERVAGDYASEKKISLLTVMEKKQKKIHALMQGQTIPFNALFIIRVWDKSKDGLNAKASAVKNAINSMNSAQYFESNLPTTSKNLFFQTWPGWTWGRYGHRKLYAEHRYLADMLPVTSTFTGHLATAEAIYDGPNHNLVGVETFSGSTDNKSPQHAVLLGMSGAGKSVTVCDLLSQTEGYFAYTVIIEEGLSYGIYTQTVEEGARPIIIHPDGDLTINYLDTKGLPLTPDHLSAATALVARMIGTSAQEDKQMLRQAQIAKYLNLMYEDAFQDWQKKRHDQLLDIARHALALQKFRTERMPPGATMLETFADFRDQALAAPEAAASTTGRSIGGTARWNEWGKNFLSQFSEGEALRFLKEPRTSREVRNLAFAYFTAEEFPTHRMLQELMMLDPIGAERDQIMEIATLLLPWCRDGNYGCLFDGTSNLSLTGKIAHFELGYIPESAKELKAAAGFLITNHARKHIITLPRSLRKRNVYEEVARFLDIPGGQEIVQESYAQLRKFNCWNISIVQQYARFKQSRIRSAVFGNSRQFFILRQNDRADLEDMAQDIALPEVTKHAIMNYPLPDHQSGQKYSPFTYFHTDSGRNLCGTVHNISSPEMLYCSSSSGEHFDKRARELRASKNIVEGIVEHSRPKEGVAA